VSDALEAALARVGDRWSLLIVQALLDGPRRFNELLAHVPGLASNILSQRLRHLEAEAVVMAVPYSERPVRFTYELTAAGGELAGALRLLSHWGSESAAGPRHAVCGTPLEARWHCPTCERPVDENEGEGLEYV
jgi:DNA-binding HxlR family transcriptional regulator